MARKQRLGGSLADFPRVTEAWQSALAATKAWQVASPAMASEHQLAPNEIDGLLTQFHEYLDKKQLRSTRQRDIVAKTFFGLSGHVNVDELLAHARTRSPKLGYATVYRTLKLLTECGLAAERRFGNESRVYEVAGDTAHHDHLICVECGHVLEFENEEIERLQDKVARSFGFTLVRHKLELYGMCPRARGIRGGSCPSEKLSGDGDAEAASK